MCFPFLFTLFLRRLLRFLLIPTACACGHNKRFKIKNNWFAFLVLSQPIYTFFVCVILTDDFLSHFFRTVPICVLEHRWVTRCPSNISIATSNFSFAKLNYIVFSLLFLSQNLTLYDSDFLISEIVLTMFCIFLYCFFCFFWHWEWSGENRNVCVFLHWMFDQTSLYFFLKNNN